MAECHSAVRTALRDAPGGRTGRRNAKGDRVAHADLTAERAIRACLAGHPEAIRIDSEEGQPPAEHACDAALRLVVDPIDGTDNFLRGLPLCALSLALLPSDRTLHPEHVLAALVGPLDGPAAPLVLAGEKVPAISTSGIDRLDEAVLSVELNHAFVGDGLAGLIHRARAVRSFGCASRALALVAAGAVDAHVDLRGRLTPESYLAGAALVRAAGGVVVDPGGGPVAAAERLTDRISLVAAATPALANEICEALR